MKSDVLYRKDMEVRMDGVAGRGMAVVPQVAEGQRHNFGVTARDKIGTYVFDSCHREFTAKIDATGFDGGYFTPNVIEREPGCEVELRAFNAANAQFSEALVEFQDAQTTLAHSMSCNGEEKASAGVTVCQTRAGFMQQIRFPEPVFVTAPDPGCPTLAAADRKTFDFAQGRGLCVYKFESIADKTRKARLTTWGYEQFRP